MTLNYSCSRFATVEDFAASTCNCQWDEVDDATFIGGVLDMASDMLALISGLRIHGICRVKVRPQGEWGCLPTWGYESYDGTTAAPWETWLYGAVFLRGPNTDIVEVLVDGTPLPSSAYKLINDHYLLRVDGQAWPTSNDPAKNASQLGTWQIEYRFGRAPDFITWQASLELACELANAFAGKPTQLPPGVTSVNIQGASVSLNQFAQTEAANELIPAVARFVALYAVDGNFNRSGVWSPELEGPYTLIEVEGPSGS